LKTQLIMERQVGKIDSSKVESGLGVWGLIVEHRSFGCKMYTPNMGHQSLITLVCEPVSIKLAKYANEQWSVGLVM
jgi:hypothetical protein